MLPATVQELTDVVLDAYNNIPRMFIRNLFRPMGRRCAAVIDNDGGHTLLTFAVKKLAIINLFYGNYHVCQSKQ